MDVADTYVKMRALIFKFIKDSKETTMEDMLMGYPDNTGYPYNHNILRSRPRTSGPRGYTMIDYTGYRTYMYIKWSAHIPFVHVFIEIYRPSPYASMLFGNAPIDYATLYLYYDTHDTPSPCTTSVINQFKYDHPSMMDGPTHSHSFRVRRAALYMRLQLKTAETARRRIRARMTDD